MRALLGATAACLLMTNAAAAGDFDRPAKAGQTWTGFYIGANVGRAWAESDISNVLSGIPPTEPGTYGSSFEPNGTIGGGQIGFNYQTGGIVLGVEADLQWSDVSTTNSLGDQAKMSYFGTVRGRLGVAMGSFMPYVTGGFAYARGEGTLNYIEPEPATFSDKQNHTGWTVGGGLEFMLTERISAKMEYLYLDFGAENYDFGYASADVGYTMSVARFGLNMRF